MSDVLYYTVAGVIFAPAVVMFLIGLGTAATDLKDERRDAAARWYGRGGEWLVGGIIAFVAWTVIALAI